MWPLGPRRHKHSSLDASRLPTACHPYQPNNPRVLGQETLWINRNAIGYDAYIRLTSYECWYVSSHRPTKCLLKCSILNSNQLTITAFIVRLHYTLLWRHSDRDGVSNHQCLDCLLNRLFRRRSKKISKPRVTGLCEGNLPVIGELPTQRVSNVENVSIWWRHHVLSTCYCSFVLRIYL